MTVRSPCCTFPAHTGDSLDALWSLEGVRDVDVVYLDSYDIDNVEDPLTDQASAEHHLKVRACY